MDRKYPHRITEIEPFRVMQLLARARELELEGKDVIHMEVGEPDFQTPSVIVEAGIAALKQGKTKYTPAMGLPELRAGLSAHYASRYNLQVPASRIVITAGASGALLLALTAILNHGEGLLMTDPGYPCYRHILTSLHGEAQLVPVSPDTRYQMTPEMIRNRTTERTRGVLLASPANPTGAVTGNDEMAALARETESASLWMLVDEIYQGLIYGSDQIVSAACLGDHLFVINSFSKYFGMTGWRLGWLVVPDSAVSLIEKLAQNLFICASSVAQEAALAAFTGPAIAEMEANKCEFEKRRDFLIPELKKLGFDIPLEPEGAFYIYARLPDAAPSAEAFCDLLLEKYHLSLTPGADFGKYQADRYIRFSYAQNIERLEEGINRLARALSQL